MADYTNKITDNFVQLALEIFLYITFFLIIAFLATYFISLRIKKETDLILNFLTQLTNKKESISLRSTYTYEFYKITKLLNKVAIKLSKKERQKAKQTAKLKLSNRQKDEIISAISHEFKNPIAIISGYSETILNDQQLPTAMKNKFLNKIHSNANKMSQIIDKLRLTLKLEEGKQELLLLPCSMKKIIENCANDLKDKYKNREILIEGDDINLKVDETLISMAISNLIENGLKYSENEIKRAYNISAGNSELMQNIISNNDSSHLIINIERAKQILSLEKYERIAQIDKLLKEKDSDIPSLLESFVKILNATYIQSLQKPQTSLTNLNRLSYALKCIDNLALGVNKKLALTQFFSKI